jgi:hypothetical protein
MAQTLLDVNVLCSKGKWPLPRVHVQTLLPDPISLKLKLVQRQDEGRVLIIVLAVGSSVSCLGCERPSHSVHSRYSRALKDLPW